VKSRRQASHVKSSRSDHHRRLLPLAAALVFVDTLFFTALVPLLPYYVDRFDLSGTQVGILSGSYALGSLALALPAGVFVRRWGPRSIIFVGLLALAVFSLTFALGESTLVLDGARAGQGAAGALIFSGALTWVIDGLPAANRGRAIGTVGGAGIFGALLGPGVGGLAALIGVLPVFAGMAAIATLLLFAASQVPDVHVDEHRDWRSMVAMLRSSTIVTGFTFLLMPAICFGVLTVIVPLRIDYLGGSAASIAAIYTAVAMVEGILSPVVGRLSDRVGRRQPYLAGIAVCSLCALLLALASALPVVVAALLVSSVGAALCVTPGFADISDAAATLSLHQGLAVGLGTMAWALGNLLGAVGAGTLASTAGGFETPLFVVSAILAGAFGAAVSPIITARGSLRLCRGGPRN
jgi:MFS family permease